MTDDRSLSPSDSDRALARCQRCGRAWPAESTACPACAAAFDAAELTVEDVHRAETMLLDRRAVGPTGAHGDPTRDGAASQAETRIVLAPPTHDAGPPRGELEPPPHDESLRTGDDLTAPLPPRPVLAPPPSSTGSSSDPPTRIRQSYDTHIELPAGSIVDEYEVTRRIGEGAMGVVYAARHLRLHKQVAVKVIAPRLGEDPQALRRFEREARALASLHHPNIVDVIGFGALPDGRSYFVMEMLNGEALADRLARGRVPLDEALDVLDQVARALEAAHSQGVVHRDLKPANIYLCHLPNEPRAIVKLVDFGLAKSALDYDRAERTQADVALGTPQYLSPEQARGPDVDGRTDLYALGCVAYELVLGTVPFPEAKTATALIAAHLHDTPPRPRSIWPQVPAALDLLLFSLLAKDAGYRPSIAQVRAAIASVRAPAAGRALRSTTESVAVRARRVATRARSAAVIGIAMIAGIVIGATAIGSRSRGDAPEAHRSAEPTPLDRVAPVAPPAVSAASAPTTVTAATSGAQSAPPPKPVEAPAPPRAEPVVAGKSPDTDVRGYLTIASKPSAHILVDGRDTGLSTPISGKGLPLVAGRHKITFVFGDDRYTFPVTIAGGQSAALTKDFR